MCYVTVIAFSHHVSVVMCFIHIIIIIIKHTIIIIIILVARVKARIASQAW